MRYLSYISLTVVVLMVLACTAKPAEPTQDHAPATTALSVSTLSPTPAPVVIQVEEKVAVQEQLRPAATPIPTSVPAATPIPTSVPAATPIPTSVPAATPIPTSVPEVAPTPTPAPESTGEEFFLYLESPASTEAVVEESSITIIGRTRVDATVTVNEHIVEADIEGRFYQEVDLESGLNIIEVIASLATGEEESLVLAVIYVP